jgi:uncharacterized OsmC-like protein/methanogenic corrinoid protein MtbC1
MKQSVPTQFREELDNQPVFNIKAVVEATGLPAATLRAWERRYGALAPGRTDSGYRLYSANDIATLQWLKQRVGEGMSISQAFALLSRSHKSLQPPPTADRQPDLRQGLTGGREALLQALLQFDEGHADQVLGEAFAMYGLEPVAEHLIAPAMAQVGDLWHRGLASTAAEHFASNFLRRKLDAIIHAAPKAESSGLIVLGCAPNDWHELGLQLIHLFLRRRGFNSLYLGQNVPVDQFIEEMARLKPVMVIIAAALAETAPGVVALGEADHLLSRTADARYAGALIAAWAQPYVAPAPTAAAPAESRITARTGDEGFATEIRAGRHRLTADEPAAAGGTDRGPTPFDLLVAALGACTSMTLRMYADRKRWPLEAATVRLAHRKMHASECTSCETREGLLDRIEREIELEGPLDPDQRRRLLQIADRCPVHKTLTSEVEITTRLKEP